MNVILLRDIEKLGTQGQVVKVKSGFARNYLIPGGLAVFESPEQKRALEELSRQRKRKLEREIAKADEVKKQIEAKKWVLRLSVGEDDKPFGAITSHDVDAMISEAGVKLEKHAVQLDEPIKTLGLHTISVRLHPEVTASISVSVKKA